MSSTPKRQLKCPKKDCGEITVIFHTEWETLVCPSCHREVPKQQWHKVYFDAFGNPLTLSEDSIITIEFYHNIGRLLLYNDLGEINELELQVALTEHQLNYLERIKELDKLK